MKQGDNRRDFIRKVTLSGIGLGLAGKLTEAAAAPSAEKPIIIELPDAKAAPDIPWVPRRTASWWCSIEDLLWNDKTVVDKIKRRAEGMAKANIDTAINFGFHTRFDFSNYFGHMNGYYNNVCEELHKHGIKFMDHYSCNDVLRPRNKEEFAKLHKQQRHSVLLFNDEYSARDAGYEGYKFDELCQVDIRDGSRGYTPIYQMETFCHNNPKFRDMHAKYLRRLLKDAPIDGFQIDDMCDYAGLNVCGCKYCRDRFRKDYGHEIPPHTDKNFWGTISSVFVGGNYENPAFRDWIKMRHEIIAEHIQLIKGVLGDRPLMTCMSSSGPVRLNSLALNLEYMTPHLDFFMLENVGFNVKSVNWTGMDAEALHQKDIAEKRGNSPAIALSYTIYERGAYLGWALSRYWGVANWASTLNGRMEQDAPDRMEDYDAVGPWYNWEVKNSNLDYYKSRDLVEVRLVNSSYCKDNGWTDEEGKEQWDKAKTWSLRLLQNSIGYRFLRVKELSDAAALSRENTPLILDGIGCVSDAQFTAISAYLAKGGIAWLALPFGTHNEKGFKRDKPLSAALLSHKYKNLMVVETATKGDALAKLLAGKKFKPVLKQVSGDKGWVARVRFYGNKPVIHFMNGAMTAVPHPTLKDAFGNVVLKDMASKVKDNKLSFEIDARRLQIKGNDLKSPELGDDKRTANLSKAGNVAKLDVDLSDIKVYAVVG